MKLKKTLTVTIGIPAYNEEDHIKSLLLSILSQKQIGFLIKKIIVVSDGSTDKTVIRAKLIKDKRIEIINSKVNLGRIKRRKQIINLSKTDILVFLDGDGILENEKSLFELIKIFNSNDKIALVGGNPYSLEEDTFLSHCLARPRDIYTRVRYQIKNGNNVFSCMGGMLAIKNNLYKKLKLPNDIFADDTFIYFSCLKSGFIFRNSKLAKVLHQFPQSWKSQINRNKRHNKSNDELKKHFDKNLINQEFYIPDNLLNKERFKEVIKYPFYTLVSLTINFYIKLLSKYEK